MAREGGLVLPSPDLGRSDSPLVPIYLGASTTVGVRVHSPCRGVLNYLKYLKSSRTTTIRNNLIEASCLLQDNYQYRCRACPPTLLRWRKARV